MEYKNRGSILLLLTTIIWGTTFAAQDIAMEYIGPYAFQAIRSVIGAAALLPVILAIDAVKKRKGAYAPLSSAERKNLWLGGMACGFFLCIASLFQQVGIAMGTSAGKSGFITAMYILFVPILEIFLGKKASLRVWCSVAIALVGLYVLCMGADGASIELSDVVSFGASLFFALQILTIGHFAPKTDCVRLSCLQFLFSGLFSSIPMFIFEFRDLTFEMVRGALFPILFAGFLSCGVAYTLQTIGQKDTEPALASLIMSLESVFAVIASALFVPGGVLLPRQLLGCGIMMVAIILSQLPAQKKI